MVKRIITISALFGLLIILAFYELVAVNNLITVAGGVATGVAGSAMRGAAANITIGMGVTSAMQGGVELVNTLIPNATTVGGCSGGAGYGLDNKIKCVTITHGSTVEPSNITQTLGTPTMEVKLLGSLTGYVQTNGASVSASADITILNTINSMLDGGRYIE